MSRYLKFVTNSQNISSWRSKGLSDKEIKVVSGLYPSVNYVNDKLRLKFEGSCLAQTKVTYTHKNIVNIYIVSETGATTRNSFDLKLINGLFGAVTLVKNPDINKFGYTGYGIGFHRGTTFSFPSGGFGHNVLVFGVDMSGLTHIDNKKKDILVLGKGPTQGFEHTLTAEKLYNINFTVSGKKFCLSLHYNGANSYLFVNGVEQFKFKAKHSSIVANPLCLGNISKDWGATNIKKTGLFGYVYDFSVDYHIDNMVGILSLHKYLMKKNNIVQMRIFVNDIKDIHKYLMKKQNSIKCLELLKKF